MAFPTKPLEGDTADGESYLSAPQRLQLLKREPPQPGEAISVAEGIRWCRIPLPIALNHINVWLVDHEDGCVVVDTGMAVSVCQEAWQLLEAQVLEHTPLRGVFVTHIHPDHIGLAGWLQQRYGVPVWMSPRTHAQLQQFLGAAAAQTSEQAAPEVERYLHAHGVDDNSLLSAFSPTRFARMTSGLPDDVRFIVDQQTWTWNGRRDRSDHSDHSDHIWRALETNGHAEGHLCLQRSHGNILISGDQVLPSISSNIGLTWRSQDLNPLHSFLSSLERLRALPPDTLVLPSHGVPFLGLQSRIDDLRAHHVVQLDAVVRACATDKSAFDLLPVMFRRPLTGVHFLLAMGEALAHLEYLVSVDRLRRETDSRERIRYRAAA